MAKHKGHHTGRIRHSDMKSLMDGHGAKDPHADPAHHAANVKHDMPHGMSPMGNDNDGDETQGLTGGNQECY